MTDPRDATTSGDGGDPTRLPTATVRTRVTVPLRFGDGYTVTADLVTFHGLADGQEHLAVVLGEMSADRPPLVRLHSECLTGDVFGSARCDCGPQLREAVERIADQGGVLLYLRQEGRGIGLYNKLTPTPCRTRVWTPTRRTPRSVCRRTPATTRRRADAPRPRINSLDCCPTTRTRRRSSAPWSRGHPRRPHGRLHHGAQRPLPPREGGPHPPHPAPHGADGRLTRPATPVSRTAGAAWPHVSPAARPRRAPVAYGLRGAACEPCQRPPCDGSQTEQSCAKSTRRGSRSASRSSQDG